MQCANCGSPDAFSRCKQCQRVAYCGTECQREHWSTHKRRCVIVKRAQNIEQLTLDNALLHAPLYEDAHMRVHANSVSESIPWETHWRMTQFVRVEQGRGRLIIFDTSTGHRTTWLLEPGSFHVIKAGESHLIERDGGDEPLKLYTVYAKH